LKAERVAENIAVVARSSRRYHASGLHDLGDSVEPSIGLNGIDRMFCAEVFFTAGGSGKRPR
jgi:hypothetical protein